MRRHLSGCFLGTTPRGLIFNGKNGGDVKGLAVWPVAHSAFMYGVITSGWSCAEERSGE